MARQWLARASKASAIELVGMTDRIGDAVLNARLAQHRADEVRRMFIAAGIRTDRISTGINVTGGITVPAQSSWRQLPSGDAAHRRVDIVMTVDNENDNGTHAGAAQ